MSSWHGPNLNHDRRAVVRIHGQPGPTGPGHWPYAGVVTDIVNVFTEVTVT